jgi:hypothetical protein
MAASHDPALLRAFPQDTDFHKQCFDLLRRAYVEARYNPGYKITSDQLQYLAECVEALQRLTRQICKKKIDSFVTS